MSTGLKTPLITPNEKEKNELLSTNGCRFKVNDIVKIEYNIDGYAIYNQFWRIKAIGAKNVHLVQLKKVFIESGYHAETNKTYWAYVRPDKSASGEIKERFKRLSIEEVNNTFYHLEFSTQYMSADNILLYEQNIVPLEKF